MDFMHSGQGRLIVLAGLVSGASLGLELWLYFLNSYWFYSDFPQRLPFGLIPMGMFFVLLSRL